MGLSDQTPTIQGATDGTEIGNASDGLKVNLRDSGGTEFGTIANPVAVNTAQFGGSAIVTGTGTSGSGIPRVTVSNDSNVLVTQSGTWNINNISGTISLPTGAATAANQTTANSSLSSIDTKLVQLALNYGVATGALRVAAQIGNASGIADFNFGTVGTATLRTASQIGNATGAADFAAGNSSAQTLRVVIASNQTAIPVLQSGTWTVQPGNTANTTPWLVTDSSDGPVTPGTVAIKSSLMGGQYNSTLPTLTNTQQVALQVDSNGRLITSGSPLPSTNAKFSFGDVATSSTTADQVVRRTAYTEQTTNATRSVASSSANDTAAGTGARTIVITYLDQTGAGPFTTTVTLNGTSYVNTSVSDICFIENIKVATVGSGGTTAGTITLKASTAGGGATIGTIVAGDRQTFWAHHYTPTGKTSYISGFSVNNSSTTTGAGALFIIRAQNPTASDSPNIQVSDFNRLYGQASSTNTRTYLSPIQVVGPARITVYVTPESSTSITQRASFDFIDN